MEVARCFDEGDVREAVAMAVAKKTPVRIRAGGTKAGLGRPVPAEKILDVKGLAGVVLYEPDELILRARAGTPMMEIEALLAQSGQAFAFEPPDLGPLLGARAGGATLGGMVAANLSGPRRFKAGALRDQLLGVVAVSGRAETFKSGGRVMKNVTGYDLPKLMAGSYGTLAVLTELTLRVAPAPEDVATIVVGGLSDRVAIETLRDAAASSVEVSGAAHLPAAVARCSQVAAVAATKGATLVRLEGTTAALAQRVDSLVQLVKPAGLRPAINVLDAAQSQLLWREVRDVSYFSGGEAFVWRISTAPMAGPALVEAVGAEAWFYDWAGGLVWLRVPPSPRADAPLVRHVLEGLGGHATLIRADDATRAEVPVFQPQPPALDGLTRRLKSAFDPENILNPGQMRPDTHP